MLELALGLIFGAMGLMFDQRKQLALAASIGGGLIWIFLYLVPTLRGYPWY